MKKNKIDFGKIDKKELFEFIEVSRRIAGEIIALREEVRKTILRLIPSLAERLEAYKKDPTDRKNFNSYTFYRGKLGAYYWTYKTLLMFDNRGVEPEIAEKVDFPILEDYDGMDATEEGYKKYLELVDSKAKEGKAPCETRAGGC